MIRAGIYKISSVLKPERFYIGSSVNLKKRFSKHFEDLRKGKHHSKKLQRHCDKYGIADLIFSEIETVEDHIKLISTEQHYLDTLKPYFNGLKVAGSMLGFKMPESAKRIISEKNKGKIMSPEARAKISKSNQGRVVTEKQREAIIRHNKTRILSEESKEKLRRAHTGMKKHTPESLLRISPIGRKHKPETIEKMRKSALIREQLKREAA